MKKKTARRLALLMAAAMTASAVPGIGSGVTAQAEDQWVSDEALTDNNTAAPDPDEVVPNKNQYRYQKDELAAFCHFGPNTFNEIEWGENYGDKTPDEIFKLEKDFDADNYVKALKDAGFKKLIVTAKHHDGFCIWASDHTTYDVAETSYKDGQGDILAEISAACTKYDMDMGLYLSPWDIHDDSYGYYDQNGQPTDKDNDYLDYNDYYNNQLEEILGSEKYGNDGHFVEVWMDGAKGSGQDAQEYDFVRWFETIQKYEGEAAKFDSDCMLFGAEAYTTVRWIGNEKGYAAKNTWSKSKVNKDNNTIDSNSSGGYTIGYEDGNQWTVPEADARITSGWFWGTTKNTPKSIEDLGSMYFGSVGNNATFLLNIPPNNEGTVDQAILDRVKEFGNNIEDTFRTNMAADNNASVKASNVRGRDLTYGPGTTVDGDDSTYWTTDDGTNTGSLLIDLVSQKRFDVVSIEEAIQNGQRINSYKVEYRNGDDDGWHLMDEGETIGAKRLVRTSAVRATQVKITVSTPEGKVPMISEVGVYKASEGFELTGGVPSDLQQIDNIDQDPNDGSYFEYTGWTQETGTNFSDGTSMYADKGAEFEVHFTGSQIYLIGTKDPNHGTAEIYIDEKPVGTIDTYAASRSLGQVIYASDTLSDGSHTLRLVVTNKAIGVEAAAVLNNGGAGMFEIEQSAYTMNEDSQLEITVNRVGGSTGEVTVLVSNEPGSAVQGHMDPDETTRLTFADGVTRKTATVTSKRFEEKTGDLYFTVTLTEPTGGAVLGFNDTARVTIKDTESSSLEALNALLEEGKGRIADWYTDGWDEYAAAYAAAQEVAESPEAAQEAIEEAIANLSEAAEGLTAREKYTEDDPFVLPWREGSSATLEAEFASDLVNDESNDKGYPLQVAEANWASNGKFLNSLNNGDVAKYYFKAEKAGTYNVTAHYRSGSSSNALSWSSAPENLITAGTQTAGANDNAGANHEVAFTITVNEPGSGLLLLTGPAGNSPQLDRLVFTPGEITLSTYTITATAGENGTISPSGELQLTEGESQKYTITPNEGYKIEDVKVNGTSVGAVSEYTVTEISENITIDATFVLGKYTEDNPFVFPTEENGKAVTLEAEHATELINSNDSDSDPNWPLAISSDDWASGGEFVNCLAYKDYIKFAYRADVAGTYEVTMTYSSGSAANKIQWYSDPEGNIARGTQAVAEINKTPATVKFNMTVSKAGAGTLILTAPDSGKGPQIDKFDIRLSEKSGETPETYTITASAGEGGTIDPSGEVTVNAGETQTFTITADEGWHISDVKVNGGSVGAVESYEMDAAGTIEASFEKNEDVTEKHDITYTAGNNGELTITSGMEDGKVADGATVTYTAAANTGFVIDTLKVNGTPVDAAAGQSTYNGTIENVKENISIEVTFKSESTEPEPETPTKKDLGDAIEAARAILGQTEKYTADSLEAYKAVIDEAYLVYESDNADSADFAAAIKLLEDGRALLVEKGGETPDPTPGEDPDKPGTGTDKPSSGSGNGADKAVKTGDNSSPILWIAVLAAACAAGGTVVRFRTKRTK